MTGKLRTVEFLVEASDWTLRFAFGSLFGAFGSCTQRPALPTFASLRFASLGSDTRGVHVSEDYPQVSIPGGVWEVRSQSERSAVVAPLRRHGRRARRHRGPGAVQWMRNLASWTSCGAMRSLASKPGGKGLPPPSNFRCSVTSAPPLEGCGPSHPRMEKGPSWQLGEPNGLSLTTMRSAGAFQRGFRDPAATEPRPQFCG